MHMVTGLSLFAAIAVMAPAATAADATLASQCVHTLRSDAADVVGDDLRRASVITWFMGTATRNDRKDESFLSRFQTISSNYPKIYPPQAVLPPVPLCQTAFPVAFKSDGVALPTKAEDRNSLCFTMGSLFFGLATGHAKATGDAEPQTRASRVMNHYLAAVSRDLEAGGRGSDMFAIQKLMDGQLEEALDFGNPQIISEACFSAI